MKNIWIFNHYIVPPSIEVGHRHNKFAKYLFKDGYNVNLFFSSAIHNTKKNLINNRNKYLVEESEQGLYIAIKTRTYINNGLKRIANMLDYFLGLFSVTKIIEKKYGIPDIIYASSVHPLTCVAGILIAKRYNVKCVVEIRDLWPLSLVELGRFTDKNIAIKLLYKLEHWIYKNGNSIIFTMEGGKDYIVDKGWDKDIDLNKVWNINNGVDLEVFNTQIKKFTFDDDDLKDNETFKVLYTGSITQSNVVYYLVEVAEKLKKLGNCNIKIIIYGDGLEKENLENYCFANNLTNIVFKGNIDKKFIPFILSKANINIMLGKKCNNLYKYGLSLNKMFEYMASGKPTISNIECNYDILKKYNCGVTVNGENSDYILEAILNIYNMNENSYNYFCKNALLAAKSFDFKFLTNEMEELFNQLF